MVQVPYKKPLSKKLYPLWFMLPFIVLVFTFFILPCFLSVYMAFTDWNITFDPQYVGLKNFQRIFKDPYFTKILGNTLVFVVISEILVEGLAIFIAILTQYFVKNKMSRYVYRTIWLSMNALPSLVYVLVMKAVFGGTSDGIMNRLQHISWHVDTMHSANQIEDGKYSMTDGSACGVPVVVFNPHEFEATQAIRFHHHYSAGHYDNGDSFPVQLVRGSRTNGKSRFDTLAYVTIPAFGYRLIWLEEDHAEHAVQPCPVQIPILENQYIRAEFDEQTGKLIHLIDKKSGIDSIKAPSSIDVIDISNADTWAHNIFRFDRKCGEFDLLDWKITEDGPACRELTVRLTYGKSEIVQQYRLYPDAKQLDVHCYLHLHEKHKLIRVCISTPYRNEYSEIPYGTIRRNACGNEEHCQRWFAMEDEKAGLAVLNNGKYSYSAQNGELRLTIANTSVYADHYGQAYRDDSCRFMDQGEQEFCYALKPYTGSWSNHSIHQNAALLNMPLRYVMESYHVGNLPAEYSGLFVDQNNAEMGAVKASEDGKGTIIRIVEKTGKHQMVQMNMPALQRNEQISLAPFEIKTLLIPADPALPIKETPITE